MKHYFLEVRFWQPKNKANKAMGKLLSILMSITENFQISATMVENYKMVEPIPISNT